MSYPYFDLATFALFHGFNNAQIKNFPTFYFDRNPTQQEWDMFIICKPVRLFVIAAAFLFLESNNTTEKLYNNNFDEISGITFDDFIKHHAEGTLNFSHEIIGLLMLKTDLEYIDSQNFKNSLHNLQG